MNRFAFDNSSLLIPDISSTLGVGYNSAVSTFIIQDVEGFSADGYIVLEELGNNKWEILPIATINTSTNTITTSSVSKFAHAFQTKVYYSRYNQVRLYRSAVETTIGNLVQTKDVDGANITNKGEKITVLEDSLNTSGFAFLVLYDSAGDVESNEFSAPIPYSLETDTPQYVIDSTLRQMRKELDNVITIDLAFDLINDCTKEIRDTRKKFSDLNDLEDSLGNVEEGQWKYSLPTDIHSNLTNSSIYALRLLGEREMQYKDKIEWNRLTQGFVYAETISEILSGATTISVTDTGVFETDGGVLFIGSDEITYTGISGDTLTGVTGVTQNHPADTYIFSRGVEKGMPRYYTVIDGALFLYPLVDNQTAGARLMIDYDKDVPVLEDMNDTLPFPSMLYIPFLKSGFLEAENFGEPTAGSTTHMRTFQLRLMKFFQVDPRVKKSSMKSALYVNSYSPIRTSRIRRNNW